MKYSGSDATGFPLIEVDSFLVQWLPVTKIQFEYFLCDARDSKYDERWYRARLDQNARVTPRRIDRRNYWQAFITGIQPREVLDFAEWCGERDNHEYRPPTYGEWRDLYDRLSQESPVDLTDVLTGDQYAARVVTLLERIDEISAHIYGNDRSLADQMMLVSGVMEWVQLEDEPEWGGLGSTNPKFQAMLRSITDPPETPRNPDGTRLHYYGFRLICE